MGKFLRLLFRTPKPEPVTSLSVTAAPPPNQSVEREREAIGLQILRQVTLTAVSASQIREGLAKDVALRLKGAPR